MGIEIIQLVISALTPMVVLILGIKINNSIEKNKSQILKEKNFDELWAMKLVTIADEYNTTVENFVAIISKLRDIQQKKPKGWKNEENEILKKLSRNNQSIQKLNWKISLFTEFCKKEAINVINAEKELNDTMAELLENGKINFDSIKEKLFKFNSTIKLAHAELLKIDN